MLNEIELINKEDLNINYIFQYNWESKFLLSIFEKNLELNKNNIYDSIIILHTNLLMDNMIYIISNFNNNIQTNYLAVAFEGLSSLLPIIKENNLDKYILLCDNIYTYMDIINEKKIKMVYIILMIKVVD